jgi:hypothetical protein
MLHMVKTLQEEVTDVVIIEGVVDTPANLAPPHQTQLAKTPQVVGNRRLANADTLSQGCHVQLTLQQASNQAQPAGLGQSPIQFGQTAGRNIVQLSLPCRHLNLSYMNICSHMTL